MEKKELRKYYLSFVIDDKTYALSVLNLDGIIGNPLMQPVRGAPSFMKGIALIKGQTIPVLDLRLILNRHKGKKKDKVCIIIVKVAFKNIQRLIGFLVDSFGYVNNFSNYEIEKLPLVEKEDEFIDGLITTNDKMILLLDLNKIINCERVITFLNQIWSISDFNSETRH